MFPGNFSAQLLSWQTQQAVLESQAVPFMEHREALVKNCFQVSTAVAGVSEIREKRGKGDLKGSVFVINLY